MEVVTPAPVDPLNVPLWAREFDATYAVPETLWKHPQIEDMSWHNDVCPSFTMTAYALGRDQRDDIRLWVEHPDPARREFAGAPRYSVNGQTTGTPAFFQSNDEADLSQAIAELFLACNYWTAKAIAGRMMLEIKQLQHEGKVPRTVRSFARLHDFIDANELGGLCTPACPLEAGSDADVIIINAAQALVDNWLGHRGAAQARGPKKPKDPTPKDVARAQRGLQETVDATIETFFNKHGQGFQFSILDLPKIMRAGRDAAGKGENIEQAVCAAIHQHGTKG